MRFHWVVPNRQQAGKYFNIPSPDADKHLWAYTLFDAAADGYISERLGAAPDHPMTIEFPEGEYLKGLVVVRK